MSACSYCVQALYLAEMARKISLYSDMSDATARKRFDLYLRQFASAAHDEECPVGRAVTYGRNPFWSAAQVGLALVSHRQEDDNA